MSDQHHVVLRALASLRLTVFLFCMAILLIFFGTLAQQQADIHTVLNAYFRTFIVDVAGVRIPVPGLGSVPLGPPGGYAIGALLLVNLIAAHATRFQVSRKRSGILMIHAGLILLLAGEFVTGYFAIESQMRVEEGQTVNYTYDYREAELAVRWPDATDPALDEVVAIPAARLRPGSTLHHPRLPFTVTVAEWWPNAAHVAPTDGQPASSRTLGVSRGFGLTTRVVPRPPNRSPKQVDRPAAIIGLADSSGQSLGNWVVWTWFMPQEVAVEGRACTIELRPRRYYKPYQVTLIDYVHQNYPGSDRPSHFSSRIRLVDAGQKVDREALIYMNHPLRHGGETFYQQGPGDDPEARYTVLQVVENPNTLTAYLPAAWLARVPAGLRWVLPFVTTLPGIALTLVGFGLTLHFVLSLRQFLGRQRAASPAGPPPLPGTAPLAPSTPRWQGPAIAAAALALTAAAVWPPAPRAEVNLDDFGRLPTFHEGRLKPLSSVGQNFLLLARGRQTVKLEGDPILLDGRPLTVDERLVLLKDGKPMLGGQPLAVIDGVVHDPTGRPLLFDGAPVRLEGGRVIAQGKALTRGRRTIDPALWVFDMLFRPGRADDYPVFRVDQPELRDLLGPEDLERTVFSFHQVMARAEELRPQIMRAREARQVAQASGAVLRPQETAVLRLDDQLARYQALGSRQGLSLLAPTVTGQGWEPLAAAPEVVLAHADLPEGARRLAQVLQAGQARDAANFNVRLAEYHAWLAAHESAAVRRVNAETWLARAAPFYWCAALYVGVLLLLCASLLAWRRVLLSAAFWLAAGTLLIHTAAIVLRMYVQGRPPVTNLYASAVFVAWFGVLVALVLERHRRQGLGTLAAGLIGFLSLVVAHNLAEGDTLEPVVAVLSSNFWLSTHVVTITMGYGATYLAGVLGIVYVVRGLARRAWPGRLDDETDRDLVRMAYGTICFALLLSFVGTVLGGIWADQSWGRFWGWDPKENGALIIVIWNALILHARWAGLVRDRGVMLLAVFGNIVTTWAWFGVNMLGIGLHSYGFMDKALAWLVLFGLSQLAIIAAGLAQGGPGRTPPNSHPAP